MGWPLNLGLEDLDKYIRVSLINHVMMLTVKRRYLHDEEFKLQVVKPNDNGKILILTDVDLLRE